MDIKPKDHWLGISQSLLEDGTNIKINSLLRVADFMRKPVSLIATDTMQQAANLVIEHRIDGIPIVDGDNHLVGMVTKTLLLREILAGRDMESTPVSAIMVTEPMFTGPDEDVSTLITINVGNLPVVDQGQLIGLVTLSDTIRAYFSSVVTLREELNTIVDSTHNGILTINETGRIVLINKAAEEFLGVNRFEVVGTLLSDLLPQSDLLDYLDPNAVEFNRKLYYNGRVFISNQTPVMNNGEVIGAVAVFQDISEFESILDELEYTKRMKDELDAVINSSFDGIHVTDGTGSTIRVNDAFARIIGASREQLVGKSMQELVGAGVYSQPITEMAWIERGPVTISQRSKPGNTLVITANPIFNESGQLSRTVINARDITELNGLKQDLEHAQYLSELYREELDKVTLADKYVVRSQKSRDLVDLCIRLGQVDTTVLIQGESGVGKEITARIIQSNSTRRDKPMITVNCAAIPEALLESELFGYAPGAFTGASKDGKAGIFETARGGTLFLDEVAELPLSLQAKMLRVIQEKEITRVGSTVPVSVDVRLIAATNQNLQEMVSRKEFRSDLFYRLNVVPVFVPPLRERKSEIPFFTAYFLKKFNTKYHLNKRIDEKAIKEFMFYDWPGNIRELENLIERAVVTYPGEIIRHISPEENAAIVPSSQQQDMFVGYKLKSAVEQLEKHLIQNAVDTFGSTRKAAMELGVSQPTIVRKAAQYKIPLRNN